MVKAVYCSLIDLRDDVGGSNGVAFYPLVRRSFSVGGENNDSIFSASQIYFSTLLTNQNYNNKPNKLPSHQI